MTQVFKGTASGSQNFGGPFIAARKVTAGANGPLTSLSFNISAISLGIDMRCCLWADNGSGTAPDKLKDWGAKTTYSTTGDKTQSLTQSYSLANGTVYWIGVAYSCSNGQISFPADTTNTYVGSPANYSRPTGTLPTDVRDSPVLDLHVTGADSWVALGASMMIWGDQSSSIATTAQMTAGSFSLSGQTINGIKGHVATLTAAAFTFTGQTLASHAILSAQMAAAAFTVAGQTIGGLRKLTARLTAGVFNIVPGWHSMRLDSTASTTNRRVNRKWWASLLNGRN